MIAKISLIILMCVFVLIGILSVAALIYFIFFAPKGGNTNSDTGPR